MSDNQWFAGIVIVTILGSLVFFCSCKTPDINLPDIPSIPTTTQPVDPFAQEKAIEAEHGFSMPEKITARIRCTSFGKSSIVLENIARGWPVYDGCDSEVRMGVKRNGQWQVAKFDHMPVPAKPRPFGKCYDRVNDDGTPNPAYGHWKEIGGPVSGEEICVVLVRYADSRQNTGKTERSNAEFGVMP